MGARAIGRGGQLEYVIGNVRNKTQLFFQRTLKTH
jgi:hypothetical protein